MKPLKFISFLIFAMIFAFGCNNNADDVTNPPNNAPVDDEREIDDAVDDIADEMDDAVKDRDGRQDDGDRNDNLDDADDRDDQESEVNTTEEVSFNFTSFDLDVEYEGNKKFEVDYDNERDGMEAEIEDQIKNENYRGDEAFNRLKPIFEEFKFDASTPDEEVISEVLKGFGLDSNYTEFDLDIDFADGTEKEYDHRNS